MAQPVVTYASPSTVAIAAYPSLGANYQPEISRLQAGLHDLAVAIDMANRSGQTQAAVMLRAQFNQIRAQVDALIARQRAEDAKPTVASRVGDFQTGVANVGDVIANLPGGFAKLLPFLLVGAGALLLLPLLRRR